MVYLSDSCYIGGKFCGQPGCFFPVEAGNAKGDMRQQAGDPDKSVDAFQPEGAFRIYFGHGKHQPALIRIISRRLSLPEVLAGGWRFSCPGLCHAGFFAPVFRQVNAVVYHLQVLFSREGFHLAGHMVGYRQVKGAHFHGSDGCPSPGLRTENPVIQRPDPANIIPANHQKTPPAHQPGEEDGEKGVLVGEPNVDQVEFPDIQGQEKELADQGFRHSQGPPCRNKPVTGDLVVR